MAPLAMVPAHIGRTTTAANEQSKHDFHKNTIDDKEISLN